MAKHVRFIKFPVIILGFASEQQVSSAMLIIPLCGLA